MAWSTRAEAVRLRRRELPSWEKLVETQYARVYNLHVRMGANPDMASDLTQDTFEQAWKSVDGFQGRARPDVWLYGVALNVNRHWRQRAGIEDLPNEQVAEEFPDPEPTALELALLKERQEVVCEAVRRLPEVFRNVVVLRYFMGVSAVEIARGEGVKAGTVRWRLHEALRRLWVLLQPTLGKELDEDETASGG